MLFSVLSTSRERKKVFIKNSFPRHESTGFLTIPNQNKNSFFSLLVFFLVIQFGSVIQRYVGVFVGSARFRTPYSIPLKSDERR